MSYEVNWEIQALDQAAGFLRDDPSGVAALWDSVSRLADEPRPLESFPYGSPALRRLRAGPYRVFEPAKYQVKLGIACRIGRNSGLAPALYGAVVLIIRLGTRQS